MQNGACRRMVRYSGEKLAQVTYIVYQQTNDPAETAYHLQSQNPRVWLSRRGGAVSAHMTVSLGDYQKSKKKYYKSVSPENAKKRLQTSGAVMRRPAVRNS